MKQKITNGEITELVMRMGIESRSGKSMDELHDMARKIIHQKRQAIKPVVASLLPEQVTLAFTYIKTVGKEPLLTMVRLGKESKFKILSWKTPTMPLVEFPN